MSACNKVLIVHNHYQQKGGEDTVVEAERHLLTSRGVSVDFFGKHNNDIKDISRLSLIAQTVWSSDVAKEFEGFLLRTSPDVIHVHNTFPLISPAIYWVADRLRIPVVQTLHNFRLFCPQAMFLRNGKVCEDCLGKIPWRGIVHGCYRNSKIQSAVLASMVTLHRGVHTWDRRVTRYIALNDFCRKKFIDGGLPANRVVVKPNFVDFPEPEICERNGFLFVGRLSVEKGIDILVKAKASVADAVVRVAGVGPESHLVTGVSGLSQLGALSGDGIRREMASASALILPSIWYENFPRTLVEAFGSGLPVIASRIGALAELVEDGVTGLLFEPGDSVDLAEKMRWAVDHPQELRLMGLAARRHYEENFTADKNYGQLMSIYADAIAAVSR